MIHLFWMMKRCIAGPAAVLIFYMLPLPLVSPVFVFHHNANRRIKAALEKCPSLVRGYTPSSLILGTGLFQALLVWYQCKRFKPRYTSVYRIEAADGEPLAVYYRATTWLNKPKAAVLIISGVCATQPTHPDE
eukprot:GHVU01161932.1.p1 GENE.GHVU01161932.1~~GHVU01161932.1.p1  ORF type:complete len:133 (+),score=9.59 GHVU01161932.1:20-418(+)